jgi:hypothetical protein
MPRWSLLLLIVLSSFGRLLSQPFVDILNIRYQTFPSVDYTDDGKRMAIDQLTANLNVPLPLKNKDIVITGGTYDQMMFSNNEGLEENLYAFNLQLGYIKAWKDSKWQTLFLLLPKFSSDNLTMTRDTYQQGGVVLFTCTKRPNLKYKAGLYYNREFFGNFFMPLAGLEWTPNPKLNIYGVLPGSMNIEYQLKKSFYVGAAYQSFTSSYRLHDQAVKSFVRNGDRFWGHNQLRTFINVHALKNLVLYSEVGYTFFRKFEVYETRTKKLQHPLFSKTRDGVLFNAGMAFRIRLEEK